jgi:hypothetical protein
VSPAFDEDKGDISMIVQSAAAGPGLESLLIEHVHRLSRWEQVFGPATALRSFGRLYTSIARRPQWLVPGEVKQCFRNATAFALVRDDVTYVEGFALDPALPIPLEHAWLVDDKGQVIDPTWDDNVGHVYYGVPFERNFVAAMMEQSDGKCGLLDHTLLRRHVEWEQQFEQGVARRPSEGAENCRTDESVQDTGIGVARCAPASVPPSTLFLE